MYEILQTANAGRLFVFSPTGKHANVLPILHEPEKERKKKNVIHSVAVWRNRAVFISIS